MGFTRMRRCEHPGCRVVLEVIHVEGRLELEAWRGGLRVTEHIEPPPPTGPRLCPEHQAEANGEPSPASSGRRRSRSREAIAP